MFVSASSQSFTNLLYCLNASGVPIFLLYLLAKTGNKSNGDNLPFIANLTDSFTTASDVLFLKLAKAFSLLGYIS